MFVSINVDFIKFWLLGMLARVFDFRMKVYLINEVSFRYWVYTCYAKCVKAKMGGFQV